MRVRTPKVIHYVEARTYAKEGERLKLDPKNNNENQVILVEEMTTF